MPANGTRGEALCEALTEHVRFLSLAQVARTFFAGAEGEPAARRFLERLEKRGVLRRRSLLAHPELSLREPVVRWTPGEPPPNFAAAAYRCQVRWTQPPSLLTVWFASEDTAVRRGGFGGRVLRPHQATHDLHVGAMYCFLRRYLPDLAAAWVPEERLSQSSEAEKLPDALLRDEEGRAFYVLDFGGAARPARVAKLHMYGERYGVPYELW